MVQHHHLSALRLSFYQVSVTAHLQLIQVVAVFAILHHSSEHQEPSAVTNEAVGSTSWRNVSSHGWDEPLVCGCRD